ncbi:MAG: hypothetical protein ACK4TF_03570 [Thermodesulfovibrionales bacterium]
MKDKFIAIKKISFYMQDEIYTWDYPQLLPPTAMHSGSLKYEPKGYTLNAPTPLSAYFLTQPRSLDESKGTFVKIGISVLYEIEGRESTLFGTKEVPFINMVKKL